jgi:hydrogenase maturation protease
MAHVYTWAVRIVGVGNPWRSDDGAGLAVARALRGTIPGVEVLEREGEPAALIEAWDGADAAWVVDAVRSGAPPGTIHRFDAGEGPLPAELFGASTHHLGVADAVELARVLGRLPGRLVVVGIEGASFGAGDTLTPEVAAAVDRLVAILRREHHAVASPVAREERDPSPARWRGP